MQSTQNNAGFLWWSFTACVDEEGFVWTFGQNDKGQLGIGNTINCNVPQKILNIPPVLSVACGPFRILILSTDANLWACGNNNFGQLCLGHKENQSTFQQTPFSNISKISLGAFHSLFQNEKGEIYACGRNDTGQLGLGHFDMEQITPTLIPHLPSNIVEFVSGFLQNLFLDSEGNVFSAGDNKLGQLGLAHLVDQNTWKKIPWYLLFAQSPAFSTVLI